MLLNGCLHLEALESQPPRRCTKKAVLFIVCLVQYMCVQVKHNCDSSIRCLASSNSIIVFHWILCCTGHHRNGRKAKS